MSKSDVGSVLAVDSEVLADFALTAQRAGASQDFFEILAGDEALAKEFKEFSERVCSKTRLGQLRLSRVANAMTFLNGEYCLWDVGCSFADIEAMPMLQGKEIEGHLDPNRRNETFFDERKWRQNEDPPRKLALRFIRFDGRLNYDELVGQLQPGEQVASMRVLANLVSVHALSGKAIDAPIGCIVSSDLARDGHDEYRMVLDNVGRMEFRIDFVDVAADRTYEGPGCIVAYRVVI